ncbi:hypothetical protein DLAC_03461 [Tieghemostelium lacteum]|uniref:EGF-like domain-containing protein n=1 Tax=Tieghemostelium lacteum TaxID=361077 RepID=A0A152A2G7_TIELA|nr:hypothetical protein DLAC_03461 [Tieghemostelium lacteum]|eukprot:KYR00295.1 hypothetical protein DLAC_03461 [Tieghemostelium lacteum]
MDSCDFTYVILITADIGDLDIISVSSTTTFQNNISIIQNDNRNFLFNYNLRVPINNNDNLTGLFLVNNLLNIGGTIQYDCLEVPFPLVNLQRPDPFRMLLFNKYYQLLEFDLVKESSFNFSNTYPDTFSCQVFNNLGYRYFSIECSIISFINFNVENITFTFSDPQSRSTQFTFNSFINSNQNPTVQVNQFYDLASKSQDFKRIYYISEFQNYQNPAFFIDTGLSSVGFVFPSGNNQPISGNILNYRTLYFSTTEGDSSFTIENNYLNNGTIEKIGFLNYLTTNYNYQINDILITFSQSGSEGNFDFQLRIEIENYRSFGYYSNYGSLLTPITYEYPYGVVGVIPNGLVTKLYYPLPQYRNTLYVYTTEYDIYDNIINPTGPIDTIPPALEKIDIFTVGLKSFLFRIQASDDISGVSVIKINFFNTLSSANLVSGTLVNGVWEKYFNLTYPDLQSINAGLNTLNLYDFAGNEQTYYQYFNFKPLPTFFPLSTAIPYENSIIKIDSLRFLINDVDISVVGCKNLLYINFSGPIDITQEIALYTPSDSVFFYGKWDIDQKAFVIPINIKPRLFSGNIEYHVIVRGLTYESVYFPDEWQLRVTSYYADLEPPMITEISFWPNGVVDIAENQQVNIGWNFTITDNLNGFKIGNVTVVSTKDQYVPLIFTIYPQPNQDPTSSQYSVSIDITFDNCTDSSYYIQSIELLDNNNNKAIYRDPTIDKFDQTMTPIMYLLNSSQNPSDLYIPITCQLFITDQTPPYIANLTVIVDSPPLNLYSTNRDIFIQFEVTDAESSISPRHLPKCYLFSNINLEVAQSISTLFYYNEQTPKSQTFTCHFKLPYGYGYPYDQLYLSINGFSDARLNIAGYTPVDLENSNLDYSIPILFDKVRPIIDHLSFNETTLMVFGYGFGLDNSSFILRVVYQDSQIQNLTSQFQSDVLVLFSGLRQNQTNFNISAIVDGKPESNSVTVHVNIVEPIDPEPLVPCKGNPLCGGPLNGKCTQRRGCQCYYPWVGEDCQSMGIPPDDLQINNSDPNVGNTYPLVEQVVLTSLIKFESLRELDVTGKEVAIYKFINWTYTNSTPLTQDVYQEYTYKTNFTNQGKITKVRVIIQYYNILTTYYFANQKLEMFPSTIKYAIDLSTYKFNSVNNSLQMVISSTFKSSTIGDSCSFQDYGLVVNSEIEYVRLQVNGNSLYCRYIKKGVIDNSIKLINNTVFPVDNQLQNGTTACRKVGINIPYYIANALVNLDFTVLADQIPAINRTGSICDFHGSSSETIQGPPEPNDNLSVGQIVGIVIGGVGALVLILVIILWIKKKYIRRRRTPNPFTINLKNF